MLIIEKVKANSQLQDERVFNSLNKIIEDVKNRDRNIFLNNGEQKDIFISENEVVFKKDNLFYKFECLKKPVMSRLFLFSLRKTGIINLPFLWHLKCIKTHEHIIRGN